MTRTSFETPSIANDTLRAVRISLRMSQDDLAKALRKAGKESDEPNDANKRLVARWEQGTSTWPRPVYARALQTVTGLPVESLGFIVPVPQARLSGDGNSGHELARTTAGEGTSDTSETPRTATDGAYTGVWTSTYEYYSSSRDTTFTCKHNVVLLQHGNQLTCRSLPNSSTNPNSPLSMDLTTDRHVVTGTWVEQTARDGYYLGARYHGTVQMLVEPTGRRMTGKWLGFGKDMDINSGPWQLAFRDSNTSPETLTRYSAPEGP